MKSLALTKQYHEFLTFVDEYAVIKFGLDEICNDHFFIAVADAFPSDDAKGYLRLVLDSFGDDFEVVNKYWVEVDSSEVDRFVNNFKLELPTDMEILSPESLTKFTSIFEDEDEEEKCDCPDCVPPLSEQN